MNDTSMRVNEIMASTWRETPSHDWASLRLGTGDIELTIKQTGRTWTVRLGGHVLGQTRDRDPSARRRKAIQMAIDWMIDARNVLMVRLGDEEQSNNSPTDPDPSNSPTKPTPNRD